MSLVAPFADIEASITADSMAMLANVVVTKAGVQPFLAEFGEIDRDVLDGLGLKPDEKLAGLIHIGTPTKPSEDRPRPALSDVVTRF